MGCGDLIAQVLIEKKSLREIDPQRMWRFTLVGIFFVVS